MSNLDLSLLIPTYNEGAIIEETLRAIAAELGEGLCSRTEILIVDDGKDDLVSVVRRAAKSLPYASVEVMRNNPPLGKGRSLALGFARAAAPVAGFLDADLSTPPSYIKAALTELQGGATDVFIASRHAPGSELQRKQSAIKSAMGDALRTVINGFIFGSGRHFTDTQCGFKFFRSDVAKVLYRDLVAADGMTDIEVLVRANLRGYRVTERPVRWKDERESTRDLKRIFWGDLKALAAIVYHYRILRGRDRNVRDERYQA